MSGSGGWTGGEAIAAANLQQECHIDVETLRRYPWLIDAYPHRYLYLKPHLGWRGPKLFPQLFTGVEILEAKGWEPVAWELGGGSAGEIYGVVMRRLEPWTPPAPPPPQDDVPPNLEPSP